MYEDLLEKRKKIAVIGLGYVGLPIALEFAKKTCVIGFDINSKRIEMMKNRIDPSKEVDADAFDGCDIEFTDSIDELRTANFFIVAVPTPVDIYNVPDLKPLIGASETVGKALKKGDYVVYESTTYPGCTEEDCLPVLEKISGLKTGTDFKLGYSPERINPGDKKHTLKNVVKVVSGCDDESLEEIAKTYELVVEAGVHRASSIKVAEASKIVENTQRDLNIALMNELAVLFDRMDIDTNAVLEAAGTKWNFLKFRPGLVGGHCIGVDPYYLTHKAEKLGYIPQVILAGRRINDSMGKFVAQRAIKEMIHAGHSMLESHVTVLGLTFKENCPDLRNSRVVDIVRELEEYGVKVQVHDPLAEQDEALAEYGIRLQPLEQLVPAAAVILAVSHEQFKSLTPERLRQLCAGNPVLIDVKGLFQKQDFESAGFRVWRL